MTAESHVCQNQNPSLSHLSPLSASPVTLSLSLRHTVLPSPPPRTHPLKICRNAPPHPAGTAWPLRLSTRATLARVSSLVTARHQSLSSLCSPSAPLRPRWKSSNRPPADEKLVSVPREAGREEPPARRLPREFGREERGLPANVPALLNAGCSPNVAHSADGVVGRDAACAGPGAPAVEIVCLWLASRTTKAGVLTEARRPGGPPRGALGVWNAWFGSEVRLVVDALMPRLSDALDQSPHIESRSRREPAGCNLASQALSQYRQRVVDHVLSRPSQQKSSR